MLSVTSKNLTFLWKNKAENVFCFSNGQNMIRYVQKLRRQGLVEPCGVAYAVDDGMIG